MPIVFNEPLSFLQRLVEYMEYVELLEQASEESDPVSRLQVSTCFGYRILDSFFKVVID